MARVLIIEDNQAHSTLYIARVEELGYESDHAADVDEAEALWTTEHYSAILLDIQLPNCEEGLDLLRKMRNIENLNHDTPVILMSICSDANTLFVARELGVESYLVKPCDFEEMAAALTRCVERKDCKK